MTLPVAPVLGTPDGGETPVGPVDPVTPFGPVAPVVPWPAWGPPACGPAAPPVVAAAFGPAGLQRLGSGEPFGQTEGSFPASIKAFKAATPLIAFGRPYTPDLLSWFDDFSTTGSYDALGGISRTDVIFNPTTVENGIPAVIPLPQRGQSYKQFNRVY